MNKIEFMYQWSMEWFGSLIDEAAGRAEQNQNLEKRGMAV
jgi:hypothetical protein